MFGIHISAPRLTPVLIALTLTFFAGPAGSQGYGLPHEIVVTFNSEGKTVIVTKANWLSMEMRRWTDQASSAGPSYLQASALNFSRRADASSIALLAALKEAHTFDEVVVTSVDREAPEGEREKFRLTLAPAAIVSMGITGNEGEYFTESITVEYGDLVVTPGPE
jgi:type VI protein secretion system component Hcp